MRQVDGGMSIGQADDRYPKLGSGVSVVDRPSGFAALTEFSDLEILRFGRRSYGTNFDPRSRMTATGQTYYVSTGGSGGNTGLTVGSPLLPSQALAKTDVGTIVFLPGTYWRTFLIGTISKSVNLIAYGPGVILAGWNNPPDLTWTLYSGSIYKCTRSSVQYVADAKYSLRTAWGEYPVYTQVASLGALTAAGQWYTDGTDCYVWTTDSRSLVGDVDIRLSINVVGTGISVQGDATVYAEGIDVEGAGQPLSSINGIHMAGTAAGLPRLTLVDCSSRYSPHNGIGCIGGASLACVRTIASSNKADGHNYHYSATYGVPDALEIDCQGHRNGQDASTEVNNGTTGHDGCRIIRVGTVANNNKGPNIADVGAAESWNLGCSSAASVAATRGWGVSGADSDTTMWFEELKVTDNPVAALDVVTGAKAYVRRLEASGNKVVLTGSTGNSVELY